MPLQQIITTTPVGCAPVCKRCALLAPMVWLPIWKVWFCAMCGWASDGNDYGKKSRLEQALRTVRPYFHDKSGEAIMIDSALLADSK